MFGSQCKEWHGPGHSDCPPSSHKNFNGNPAAAILSVHLMKMATSRKYAQLRDIRSFNTIIKATKNVTSVVSLFFNSVFGAHALRKSLAKRKLRFWTTNPWVFRVSCTCRSFLDWLTHLKIWEKNSCERPQMKTLTGRNHLLIAPFKMAFNASFPKLEN